MTSVSTPESPVEAGGHTFLDVGARAAQAAVEQKFLFRKIGLPFDYASDPEDFPSKAFANAREARQNLPNASGLGSGFHFTCRNHALLFDSYLLRLESGIEAPGDEGILDRLIGGLIRLATVAPKSFLVGGLAPDGHGFYGTTRRENHAAWAFAVTRGLLTAAIAPESQEKFRSIVGKWMDRIHREKYRIHTIDGKPTPNGDISQPEADGGPFLLAMLLTAAKASADEKDWQTYEAMAEENERARLGEFAAEDAMPPLLWRQAAWSLIAEHDPVEERRVLALARMRGYAVAAARHIADMAKWDAALADITAELDWRAFPKAPVEESAYGFQPPESWRRFEGEAELESGLSAAYIMMLARDKDMLEPSAPAIKECLATVEWRKLTTLSPLALAIAVHARGVELGLWDEGLYDTRREAPSSEISIAAKYLEPDYDAENPGRAGHAAPLAPPSRADGAGKRRRRKRRR